MCYCQSLTCMSCWTAGSCKNVHYSLYAFFCTNDFGYFGQGRGTLSNVPCLQKQWIFQLISCPSPPRHYFCPDIILVLFYKHRGTCEMPNYVSRDKIIPLGYTDFNKWWYRKKNYVLLTAHLSIILVNNQLDAQFFSVYVYFDTLHVSSNHVLISEESIVTIHLAYVTLCRWPSGMQVWMEHPHLHTRRSPT